jgi:hypothetical protein
VFALRPGLFPPEEFPAAAAEAAVEGLELVPRVRGTGGGAAALTPGFALERFDTSLVKVGRT